MDAVEEYLFEDSGIAFSGPPDEYDGEWRDWFLAAREDGLDCGEAAEWAGQMCSCPELVSFTSPVDDDIRLEEDED